MTYSNLYLYCHHRSWCSYARWNSSSAHTGIAVDTLWRHETSLSEVRLLSSCLCTFSYSDRMRCMGWTDWTFRTCISSMSEQQDAHGFQHLSLIWRELSTLLDHTHTRARAHTHTHTHISTESFVRNYINSIEFHRLLWQPTLFIFLL
jgi:hypothetical protein